MKKITSLLCAMLAFGGLTAQAQEEEQPLIDVVLDVDVASHVKVSLPSSSHVFELVDGVNTIKMQEYQTLEIAPVSPWALDKVLDQEGTPWYFGESVCRVYPGSGASYKITTYDIEATRTATATINIDDASLVRLTRGDNNQEIELQNGTNSLKFNPETEQTFHIYPNDKPIYNVKLNGVDVPLRFNSYELTLTDGCTVDITAIIPDIEVNVTFTFADEVSKGYITGVTVDDKPIENFNEPIKMKAGQSISITGNDGYSIDEFKVNGEASYISGIYNAYVMTDTEFFFKAHPYRKLKVTVNVENPASIIVGNGYYVSNAKLFTLNPGANEIELSENNTMICWEAAAGYLINSVVIDGETQNEYTSNAQLKEGSVVTFTTSEIEYDKTAVIWIDKKELAEYFSSQAADGSTIEIQNGYTEVPFYDGMLPISLSWYSENAIPAGEVYVNNQLQNPFYPGSFTYYLKPLEDGSVIKIFFAAKPVECAVTFNVAEGVQVAAKADHITEIADLAAPLTVFAGTEIALAGAEDSELLVKVNDTEITPAEDGTYTLTVNDPKTTISVAAKPQDSIDEITVRANSADAIYDLQGRRVAKAGKGIYIINGKQTLLR